MTSDSRYTIALPASLNPAPTCNLNRQTVTLVMAAQMALPDSLPHKSRPKRKNR
jgi:hypothetical protein